MMPSTAFRRLAAKSYYSKYAMKEAQLEAQNRVSSSKKTNTTTTTSSSVSATTSETQPTTPPSSRRVADLILPEGSGPDRKPNGNDDDEHFQTEELDGAMGFISPQYTRKGLGACPLPANESVSVLTDSVWESRNDDEDDESLFHLDKDQDFHDDIQLNGTHSFYDENNRRNSKIGSKESDRDDVDSAVVRIAAKNVVKSVPSSSSRLTRQRSLDSLPSWRSGIEQRFNEADHYDFPTDFQNFPTYFEDSLLKPSSSSLPKQQLSMGKPTISSSLSTPSPGKFAALSFQRPKKDKKLEEKSSTHKETASSGSIAHLPRRQEGLSLKRSLSDIAAKRHLRSSLIVSAVWRSRMSKRQIDKMMAPSTTSSSNQTPKKTSEASHVHDKNNNRTRNTVASLLSNDSLRSQGDPTQEKSRNKNGAKNHNEGEKEEDNDTVVPAVALSLESHGVECLNQGRLVSARQALVDALALKRKLAPGLMVADIMNNLGNCANLMGRYDESLDYYKHALEDLCQHENKNNSSVLNHAGSDNDGDSAARKDDPIYKRKALYANCLFNIGRAEVQRQQWDAAMTILSEAWRSAREVFGETHTFVAQALDLIGYVQFSTGEFKSALVSFQGALQIYQQQPQPLQHQEDIANSFCNVGLVREVKGEYKTAYSCYGEALKIYERMGTSPQQDPGHECAKQCVQRMEGKFQQ